MGTGSPAGVGNHRGTGYAGTPSVMPCLPDTSFLRNTARVKRRVRDTFPASWTSTDRRCGRLFAPCPSTGRNTNGTLAATSLDFLQLPGHGEIRNYAGVASSFYEAQRK